VNTVAATVSFTSIVRFSNSLLLILLNKLVDDFFMTLNFGIMIKNIFFGSWVLGFVECSTNQQK